MRKCVITLSRKNFPLDKKILTWNLNSNSVVDKWVDLVNSNNAHGPLIKYTTWGMYDDPERIVEVLASINESINWFNEINGCGFIINPLLRENVNRHSLNVTHAAFETYALKFLTVNLIGEVHKINMLEIDKNECPCDIELMAYHLGNINQCVHAMEKIIEINPHYVCASFSTYLLNSEELPIEVPLAEEDYSLFTLGYDFGDLMLGYATTGKTLFHIYKDDNLDLVESGGHVSPQRVIATNVLGMFYEGTLDEYERNPFYKWCDDKNIAKYGLIKDDPKNTTGNIVLGTLERTPETETMSKREFVRYHTDYPIVESMVILH
jgi:hypothetical protein